MRPLLLAGSLFSLGGCGLLMPAPDPSQAWIDLKTRTDSKLHAAEVDAKPWGDGRYFQVNPGAHELKVRFQFAVDASNIGPDSEPHQRDCKLELHYGEFAAGNRYQLEAGSIGFRPWAKLYDSQRRLLGRAREMRCGGV